MVMQERVVLVMIEPEDTFANRDVVRSSRYEVRRVPYDEKTGRCYLKKGVVLKTITSEE